MIKKHLVIIVCFTIVFSVKAQLPDSIITVSEAENIMNVLASDSLGGRVTYTTNAEKTADFITNYFLRNEIEPLSTWPDYKAIYSSNPSAQRFFLFANDRPISHRSFYINSPHEYFDSTQWQIFKVSNCSSTEACIDSIMCCSNDTISVIHLPEKTDSLANKFISSLPYNKKFIVFLANQTIKKHTNNKKSILHSAQPA